MKANSLFIGLTLLALWFWQYSTAIPAPDVTFTTITGKKIELAKLQGKPVIVTFWATDCASCINEMPHLIELYSKFHSKGLEMIAVAMYYDPPNHVVNMAKAKLLPYDVALDLKAEHAFAFGQIQLIPSTILISPTGHIIMQETGKFDIDRMTLQINNLLQG